MSGGLLQIEAIRVLPYCVQLRAELSPGLAIASEGRRGWLLALQEDSGRVGWGDLACWPGFGSSEASCEAALAQLRLAHPQVEARYVGLVEFCRAWGGTPEVAHALGCALLDLLGQREGLSAAAWLSRELGLGPPRSLVVHRLEAGPPTAGGGDPRPGAIKLKAREPARALRLCQAWRERHPGIALRVDANGRWRDEELLRLEPWAALAAEGPLTWEQPLPAADLEGHALLRLRLRGSGVRLALDEAVREEADLERALALDAADELVLKPLYLGGPCALQPLAARARAAGWALSCTHGLESALGQRACAQLAAAFAGPARRGVSQGLLGCHTADLLAPLEAPQGVLDPASGPGLGLLERERDWLLGAFDDPHRLLLTNPREVRA